MKQVSRGPRSVSTGLSCTGITAQEETEPKNVLGAKNIKASQALLELVDAMQKVWYIDI